MFCTQIDIASLDYKSVSTNRNGGKQVHISTVPGSSDYAHRMRFQMSEGIDQNLQTAIWGLSTPMAGQDASRRTLELSIDSPALMDWLKRLDEHNIATATARCQDWFKKSLDQTTIASMYVPLVRPSNKPDGSPTVRVKVKCAERPTNIFVVDSVENGELNYHRGTPDDLTRNVKVMVMVESAGLWFMSRQFGLSLTAADIMVWPQRRATGIESFTFGTELKMKEAHDAAPIDDPMGDEEGPM